MGLSWGVISAIIENFLPISSGWVLFLFGLVPSVYIAKEVRLAVVVQCEDYVKELNAVKITQTERITQEICNSGNIVELTN